MNARLFRNTKRSLTTAVAAAALLGLPIALSHVTGSSLSPIGTAYAAGQGSGQGQGGGQGGQTYGGGGTHGGGGAGSGAGGVPQGTGGGGMGAGGVPQGTGGGGMGAGGVPKGASGKAVSPSEESSEDSDRPAYAGQSGKEGKPGEGKGGAGNVRVPGTKMGDLYGDLLVILRDANGVPILDANGHVQPLDKDGNLIPLDDEGEPLDPTLVVPVDLGRLNLGRAPDKVLDKAYTDAIDKLNSATSVTVDEAGRLVLTIDGEVQTIDSPRENLALYVTLMEKGYLPNLTASDSVLGSLSYLKDSSSGLTTQDLQLASSLLAAGTDKEGTLTLDEVAYLNSILGVAKMTPESYVDYSSFNYDRAAAYPGTITYVVQDTDGTYRSVTEPILDAVFGGQELKDTDGGIDAFTQAADDARAVIEFVHEAIHPAE